MKWPLAWRSTLDADVADFEDTLRRERVYAEAFAGKADSALAHRDEIIKRLEAKAERDLVASEARYSELMTRFVQLTLQGFTAPAPIPTMPVVTLDPVQEAVNAACAGKDPKVRAQMLRQIAIDRDAKLAPEDIILRIQRGNRPAEDVQ